MGARSPRHRWPNLVDACAKCGKTKDEISYGRRGLCISCAQAEISAGTIDNWDPLSRKKSNPRNTSPVYKTVTHIGIEELSRRVGVDQEEIREWLEGHPVPSEYAEVVKCLLSEIRRMTSLANKGEREEEFFKYVDTGRRIFDGKTL